MGLMVPRYEEATSGDALWLHAAYCHAGDMRCDFLVTGEMHIGYMQCKHMLAPRGMIL